MVRKSLEAVQLPLKAETAKMDSIKAAMFKRRQQFFMGRVVQVAKQIFKVAGHQLVKQQIFMAGLTEEAKLQIFMAKVTKKAKLTFKAKEEKCGQTQTVIEEVGAEVTACAKQKG